MSSSESTLNFPTAVDTRRLGVKNIEDELNACTNQY